MDLIAGGGGVTVQSKSVFWRSSTPRGGVERRRRPDLARQAGRVLAAMAIVLATFLSIAHSDVAGAAKLRFGITTTPALVPPFNPTIHDYAIRCAGDATTAVSTTGPGTVTIGGQTSSQPTNLDLPLAVDQSVQVTSGPESYSIRCLPSDFPNYSAMVSGHRQASGYLVTIGTYVVAFDTDGVPVWWFDEPGAVATYVGLDPVDAKFLTPTSISWHDGNHEYQVRALDGSLQSIVGGGSISLDVHDLQLLPNGDYLGIQYPTRELSGGSEPVRRSVLVGTEFTGDDRRLRHRGDDAGPSDRLELERCGSHRRRRTGCQLARPIS